jgi:serine/threonine protein kinase
MNYEELVETRDVRKSNKVKMPYGYFHKRQIDGKYSNFVEFLDELSDNILFAECLKKDCEVAAQISDRHQLHFTPNAEDGANGIYAIAVEPGNYLTIGQLLNEVPSVVAQKGFLENTIKDLLQLTTTLNEKGVQQVCFAPSNVFVRRNDYDVRLILHGSSFHRLGAEDTLYDGIEEYIAPEVLRGETPTDRSDVYGLGKFIEYLNASSGLPIYLKSIIKKATSENPEARYATVADFRKALSQCKATVKSAVMSLSAIAIALILAGLFFTLTPDTEAVEFVKRVEEPISEELLDEGFDPSTELGAAADSATIAKAIKDYQMKDSDKIDEKKLREFEAKGEAIFRKQFSKEAERILSGVYNKRSMSGGQKSFEEASSKAMGELVEKQIELSEHSSLPSEKSQRIASEIIEQITEKKKAEMSKESE